jgi:hypothetical protein
MSFLRNKPSIQAVIMLMLVSAVLHMLVLALHFLMTLDYAPFNFFRIIGLDIFYPDFVASNSSGYISVITIVGIYFFSYLFLSQKKI